MKIIFHVDELTKWQLCLGNVTNMSNYYQVQNIDYQNRKFLQTVRQLSPISSIMIMK